MNEVTTDGTLHNGVIADIAEINPRTDIALAEEERVSFLPMQNTSESGSIIALQERAFREVSKGYTRFAENDVLVAKITPCFENGKGGYAKGLLNGIGFGSTEFHIVRAIPGRADSRFLHHLTRSERFRRSGEGSMTGSAGQKRIPADFIKEFPIFIPPLPEQKKIAEILSGIDKVIANLDLQKTKHEQLFSSMLSKVFIELQEANRVCRIGDICEVKRGASPRPIQSREWWGQGRGWTRISDVTKSKKYLYATKDRLSPAGEQKSVPIDPGSIILSICATIGLPVIPQIPVCIHDGFVWFDGIEKEVLPEFAYYFFLSVREGLLSGRQTGTQGNLNTSIVSQQSIPVPTQNEQRRIIKILSEMEFQGEKIERKIQSHIHLKSSISADLLSGRTRVSV